MSLITSKAGLSYSLVFFLVACSTAPAPEPADSTAKSTVSPSSGQGSASITAVTAAELPESHTTVINQHLAGVVPGHEGDDSAVTDDEPRLISYYSYDDNRDPLEPFNRTMWDLNYTLFDPYIAKPVSQIYSEYLYDGVKEGSNNMVQNLREPSTAVNHMLQLNIEDSLAAVMRFLLNSTLGLAGYYDLAAQLGLERNREDFSDVLGKVGFGEGPYVMLPILGPKTVREYVGDTVDKSYFPFNQFTLLQDFIRWGVDGLYKRDQLTDQEVLLENSVDPYLFVKDAYLQYREFQFYDGNPPQKAFEEEAIPDEFLDELD